MSSLDNFTIIASSNEFCPSCGGGGCGDASTSDFTCLSHLDINDKTQDMPVSAESKVEPQEAKRVKKYVGDVDLPESW